jgi:DNA end-binding protein Ku
MAKKSIKSLVIQFGMVAIPVNLYPAASPSERKTTLNQLHATCGARLNQVMVCRNHPDKPDYIVPKEDITKGYEYTKGQYVPITSADLDTLPISSGTEIAITSVCPAHEIDPVYYERTYFLEPDKGGAKPFVLLAKALKAKELVALATITIRKKEQLCLLRVAGERLYLHPLFHQQELNIEGAGSFPAVTVSERELEMAGKLLEQLEAPFDPEEHSDPWLEAFNQLVEARVADPNAVLTAPTTAQPKAEKENLLAALEASLTAPRRFAKAGEVADAPAAAVLNATTVKKGARKTRA